MPVLPIDQGSFGIHGPSNFSILPPVNLITTVRHMSLIQSHPYLSRTCSSSFLAITVKMSVTIHPAPFYTARQWNGRTASSPNELLKGACPKDHQASKSIIQTSFEFDTETSISPLKNGFVHAAIDAYSYHHHLTLRPEDIWFAILTQLSLYINEHAEELRTFFVAHEGQKELWIIYDSGSIHVVDMGDFAQRMGGLLSKNMNDPELHPWIIPASSTTTAQDCVVASVIMMGAVQKYFAYGVASVVLFLR